MAKTTFTVTCPSCEAAVPIKGPAAIGKKTECPKCKYRFVVPDPDEGGEEPAAKKGDKAAKKGKKPAKKGSPMVLVGVLLGVLAVGLLVVGGIFLFGDDGSSNSSASTSNPGQSRPTTNPTPPPNPGVGGATEAGGTDGAAGPNGGQTTPAAGGDEPMTPGPGGGPQPPSGSQTAVAQPTPPPAPVGNLKDVTNLLPGDTVAVYRVNADRAQQMATPLVTNLLDASVREMFRQSFTFGPEQVETYIHCVVNPDRDPFAVIRTKTPFNEKDVYQKLSLEQPKNPVIRGRTFFLIKQNPAVDSVSKTFNLRAIAGMFGVTLPPDDTAPTPAGPEKRYALCVYDAQTLLVSTELTMEAFLNALEPNGYPPFKTELTKPDALPPPMNPMGPGEVPGPGGFSAPAGGREPGAANYQQPIRPGGLRPAGGGEDPNGGQQRPGPMGPMGPMGPGTGQPPRKLFTSIPTYRTVDPALKRMLNSLEDDEKNPPAAVYAEMVDQRFVNPRLFSGLKTGIQSSLTGFLTQVKVVGVALKQLNKEKGAGTLHLEYLSDDDARNSVTQHVSPNLPLIKFAVDALFNLQPPLQIRDNVSRGGAGGQPNPFGGLPGSFPGEGGFGPGGPGGFPGSGGPGGMPDPRGPGGRMRPGGGPPIGGGGGDGEGGPGGFGPMGPGGGFPQFGRAGQNNEPSLIELTLADKVVTINVTINWTDEKYATEVQNRIARLGRQVKGRMNVLAGDVDFWGSLAAALPRAQKKGFPKGTLDREVRDERYRLPFPPEQRVSFLAELLPYLPSGRGVGLRTQINDKKAWYDKDNQAAAEAWVPEFLVPHYPQTAWRATHPKAEGISLGATNYVGLAGLGLDAARYDPKNLDLAKKVGMTGYDWGSRPDEVKDGLSNTIYLIQAPPNMVGPWIAGGGSTLRGVDESASDPMAPYVSRRPDGQRGAYVLMGDGSVRWLKEGTPAEVFKGMVTRAGGESLKDLDAVAPKQKPSRPFDTDLVGGAGAIGAAVTPSGPPPISTDELKKFQGKWRATTFKIPKVTDAMPKDLLAEVKVELSVEGTQMVIHLTGPKGGKDETMEVVKLDPSASPKMLDIKGPDGKVGSAIYDFAGGKLKMSVAEPGKPRPTKLGPPEGKSEEVYFEFERQGK